jgi:hypothetical protein
MSAGEPFNPHDKKTLGLTVARAMLESAAVQLPIVAPFPGAGIYAIYYVGSEYAPYRIIAQKNVKGRLSWPIYIGKAVPAGARKGILKPVGNSTRMRPTDSQIAGPLFKRILEHSESIAQAKSLSIKSFLCRYLTVDDIWIPLGESVLINELRPIWNLVIDGFGNHDPGSGRREQMKSSWDVLHPGRPWAAKLAANKRTETEILENLAEFVARYPNQVNGDLERDEDSA